MNGNTGLSLQDVHRKSLETAKGSRNGLFSRATLVKAVAIALVALVIETIRSDGMLGGVSYDFSLLDDIVLTIKNQRGAAVECFETWPMSAGCVVKFLPWLLGFSFLVVVANMLGTILEKPSELETKTRKDQSRRRHEAVEMRVEMFAMNEDLKSDERGRCGLETFTWSLDELSELGDYNRKTMENGVWWAWALLEKELRIALKKTKEGIDQEYADGTKLEGLLDEFRFLQGLVRRTGIRQDRTERERVRALYMQAKRMIHIHKFKGIGKALGLIYQTHSSALAWVVLQMFVTSWAATLSAVKFHYQAQAFESIIMDGNEFWEAVTALVLIELYASVLELLSQILAQRGEEVIAKEVTEIYYCAVTKKDMRWWSLKDNDIGYEFFDFGTEVKNFLKVPEDFIFKATNMLTHAFLILQQSSKSLYLLLAVNFGTIFVSWVNGLLCERLRTYAMRGVLKATNDDYTWMYAISPQYVQTYQSFVRGKRECRVFSEYQNMQLRRKKREFLVSSIQEPVNSFVRQASMATQLSTMQRLPGVGLAKRRALVESSDSVVLHTQGVFSIFNDILGKAEPLAKVYDLCNVPSPIDLDKGFVPENNASGHIQFEGVRFAYPDRKVEVLNGATFEVLPGESIGITGRAGCGKSTAIRLLERFYDVTGGRILLDGRDIRDYNPLWLRSQIAVVSQEPKLMPMTVRENIAFGCSKEPTLEEIEEACRAANIYDQLMDKDKFPNGLLTEMETMQNVSGGEKQRIAIARAILADRPILILDEATSALDEENQELVQKALNKLMEGRTTLAIAHRLSTIKASDRIVTFDNGRVVESGTHIELIKKPDSMYGCLWKKQSSCPDVSDPQVSDDVNATDVATDDVDDENNDENDIISEDDSTDNDDGNYNQTSDRNQNVKVPKTHLFPRSATTETRMGVLERQILALLQGQDKEEFSRLVEAFHTEAARFKEELIVGLEQLGRCSEQQSELVSTLFGPYQEATRVGSKEIQENILKLSAE